MMILCGVMVFGEYFCYDFPASYQKSIEEKFDIDYSEYNLLYSTYDIPNFFLPVFAGILIDKFGVRMSLFLFSLSIVLGQSVCAVAVFVDNYYVMLVGRILYGCASCTLAMAISN